MTRKLLAVSLAGLLGLVAAGYASGAMAALDDSNICLHDGRGGKTTGSKMPNCELPVGVDGGFYEKVGNYYEFRASRHRVSEQSDVNWIGAGDITRRGLYDGGAAYRNTTAFAGVRMNNMGGTPGPYQTLPIIAHGKCRYVYNNSGKDIFIPLNTPKEWDSFLNNLPNGVSTTTCAFPCPGTCDNGIYYGITSMKKSVPAGAFGKGDVGLDDGSKNNWFAPELPFAPTGERWPTAAGAGQVNEHTFSYRCEQWKAVPNSSPGYCLAYTTVPEETTCDPSGKCVVTKEAQTYCSTPGSSCELDGYRTWKETWYIPVGRLLAGVGAYGHSGWEIPGEKPSEQKLPKTTRPCKFMEETKQGIGKVCGERIPDYGGSHSSGGGSGPSSGGGHGCE